MVATRRLQSAVSLFFHLAQLAVQATAATRFASHVTVNTPARSYTHGVGNPVSVGRYFGRPTAFRSAPPSTVHTRGIGYPRIKPAVPFTTEDKPGGTSRGISPWQHNSYIDVAIPLLPPSPYRVDSSDPESLWPEGLFLPPINPPSFVGNRRSDTESDPLDPFLLEGSEAIAAVAKATRHGLLYFHDIPHIDSLLENQNLRLNNNLKPHRIGSIRHTWPYNRP